MLTAKQEHELALKRLDKGQARQVQAPCFCCCFVDQLVAAGLPVASGGFWWLPEPASYVMHAVAQSATR